MVKLSVDSSISELIEIIKTGEIKSKTQFEAICELIYDVAYDQGKMNSPAWLNEFHGESWEHERVLLAAENLGLVKKEEHKRFISKFRIAIKFEEEFNRMLHKIGSKSFYQLAQKIKGKSFSKRITYLKNVFSKEQFDKLIELDSKRRVAKDLQEKKRLTSEFNKLSFSMGKLIELSVSRQGTELRSGKKMHSVLSLRNAMREGAKRGNLSSRDMDKLQRNIDALKKPPSALKRKSRRK